MPEPERPLAQRAYALLLRLFPREFRGDFGDQMTEDFRDQQLEAVSTGSRTAAWRLWTRTTWDVLRSAPREHLDLLFRDVLYAGRRLRRNPLFAVTAVMILSLAIGANTAIFSIADAVLFRSLPYRDPQSVFILQNRNHQGQFATMMSYDQLQLITDHHRGLSEVGTIEPGPRLTVIAGGVPEPVPSAAVSSSYFRVLEPRFVRGRSFASDDTPGRAAILSFAGWKQRFGGDESVVGRSVTLGSATFEIVGILSEDFVFPTLFITRPQIVTLMGPKPLVATAGALHPIVRLEPDTTRVQAQAEIEALIGSLSAATSKEGQLVPQLFDVRSILYPVGRRMMEFLLVSSALVLFLGCSNLSVLMLARARRERPESAVRSALGASPLRLMRPAICEALLIAVASAALALVLVSTAFDTLLRLVPRSVYRTALVGIDLRVTIFTFGLAMLGGIVCAALPAWRSTRLDPQPHLQGRPFNGTGRAKIGRPLLALQVAITIVLLFGAGITGRALLSILRVPLGFQPENIVVVQLEPPQTRDMAARRAFYLRALESAARVPGVVSVGGVGSLPLDGSAPDDGIVQPGSKTMVAGIVHVLPGYFETLGIALRSGRLPDPTDVRDGAEVAVVSESAGRALFPDREPLGSSFYSGIGRKYTVVGVVADVRTSSQDLSSRPLAYVYPGAGAGVLLRSVVVRVHARQAAVIDAIRKEMAALGPGRLAVQWWVDPIAALDVYRSPRFQTVILGAFALLALALTTIGVFGVVAFLAGARVYEMGVRLAIGATPQSLVSLMIVQALAPIGAGLLTGLVATPLVSRIARSQLLGLETNDPIVLATATITVSAAALLAAYLPARHASRVDPNVVLRNG